MITKHLPTRDPYEVTAHREGNWWVFEVADIGTTQARTLAGGRSEVTDLIEAVTGQAPPPVDALVLSLSGEEATAVREVRAATEDAALAQAAAAAAARVLVRRLLDEGWTKTDVAFALDVSKQRVTQLARSA